MRRAPLIAGLVAGALTLGPATAGAETLFDHIDETPPQSTLSQDFPSSDDLDTLVADDFTVPAGETWRLESAEIPGTSIGPVSTDQWNVTVFADAGGLPGATLSTGTLTVPGFDDPTVPLSSVPTLAPGTYWLGVQAIMDDGPGLADAHRWFWSENDVQSGNRSALRNPGGGLSSCATFGTRSTCLNNHPSPDQSFRLNGTRTVTPIAAGEDPACTAAKAKLAKAKGKLKKAKSKAADAKGKAKKKRAKAKVTQAKAKVKKAKAEVKEAC